MIRGVNDDNVERMHASVTVLLKAHMQACASGSALEKTGLLRLACSDHHSC